MFGLGVLVVLFAVMANAASGLVPPLRDEVRVTALGEKNEAAKKDEVFIEGFTVDGKTVAVEDPVEGSWYWMGDVYCWRPATDVRRPAEITDSIVLRVPVGWGRTIDFQAHEWRGLAELETKSKTWTVDCYMPTRQTMRVELGQSSLTALILNQVRNLAVYAVVLAVLSLSAILALKKAIQEPERAGSFWARHWDTAALALLAIFTFCVLWREYPKLEYFDGDGSIALGMAAHPSTIWEALGFCAKTIDIEPPLWMLLAWPYYQIAPTGVRWLFLLPNLYLSVTVFLTGKFVKKYTDAFGGIASALLMMASATLLDYGENIRSYSLVVPITLFLVYSYTELCMQGRNRKNTALFILAMVLTAYCNYHALLLLVGVFIFDMLRNRKGWKLKLLRPYVIAGLCYLPWLIIMGMNLMRRLAEQNTSDRFSSLDGAFLRTLLFRLGGENILVLGVFILASIFIAYRVLRKKGAEPQYFFGAFSLYLIVFFCAAFLAQSLLHPTSSFLLHRYFIPVYYLAVLVEGCFLCGIGRELCRGRIGLREGRLLPVILSAVLAMSTLYLYGDAQPSSWITSVDKLLADSELYYQDNCVLMFQEGLGTQKSWALERLIRDNGRPPVDLQLIREDEIEKICGYDKLYVYTSSPQQREMLKEYGYEEISHPDYYLFIFDKAET